MKDCPTEPARTNVRNFRPYIYLGPFPSLVFIDWLYDVSCSWAQLILSWSTSVSKIFFKN